MYYCTRRYTYISRWHTTYTRIAIDKLQGNPVALDIRFPRNYVLIQFKVIEHNISAKKKTNYFTFPAAKSIHGLFVYLKYQFSFLLDNLM